MSKNYTEVEFEFYLAIKTDTDNYSAGLARLMLKSDPTNFRKLSTAFPEMALVVNDFNTIDYYFDDLTRRIKGGKDNG